MPLIDTSSRPRDIPEKKISGHQKHRLTPLLATEFFRLVSQCETSLSELLRQNPQFPNLETWLRWRRKHDWLREAWDVARTLQAEHLAQKCLDIAKAATPQNAHAQRLKFDVYRQVAKWFHPAQFGDKPDNQNVTVGIAINQTGLASLREKLSGTQARYKTAKALPAKQTETLTDITVETGTIAEQSPQPRITDSGSDSELCVAPTKGTDTRAQKPVIGSESDLPMPTFPKPLQPESSPVSGRATDSQSVVSPSTAQPR